MNYLIRSKDAPADYWSNKLGWTAIGLADQFTEAEKNTLNLPMDGEWVPAADSPDYGLTAEQLRDKYGGYWEEHPKYPITDWHHEVADDNTRLGYWEWAAQRIEEDEG